MKDLGERTFALLEETGLNWTVKKETLISSVDAKKTDSFGLFRNDNGTHLGTVKKRYEVYQNYQLAEALIQATEEINMNVSRGGMLNGGAKVYLQAELPSVYIGKSDMKRMITGLNSHDGSRAIAFGSTDIVVVCHNTFHMAYGDLSKFRHTASAKEQIKIFIEGMRIALGLEEKKIETMRVMADVKINEEIFNRLMNRVFNVSPEKTMKEASQREKDKLMRVADSIETEIKLEGNSLWGLFNGITRYTNHVAPKEGKRDEYIMIGKGYETNLTAFKVIENYLREQKLITPELIEA